MSKKILLTGDRPTGPLHLGHYVGSLKKRVSMQNDYESYIMLADAQAITDNFKDINKVRTNIFEVACDYLAVGIDPKKSNIFVQSCLPELPELTMYFLNLVSIERIGHNPTVKLEVKMRGFKEVPAGFYLYPIYQVSDIVAFKANAVPVGPDQLPMIELAHTVVRKFNELYQSEVLVLPEAVLPESEKTVAGIDGQKMSKSLNNGIYLSDEPEEIEKKIKKIKSDPSRTSINDPGDPEKAIAFSYLDLFDPEPAVVADLKERYRQGGLPDKVVKERLLEVLLDFLKPIRERRKVFHGDKAEVFRVIREGTEAAKAKASATLQQVKEAMGIAYRF